MNTINVLCNFCFKRKLFNSYLDHYTSLPGWIWHLQMHCLTNENCLISNKISLQHVSYGLIGRKSALVLVIIIATFNAYSSMQQFLNISRYTTSATLALILNALTHWDRDKMDAISQTTFSNAFSRMKMFEYRLKFHWSLFPRVRLTISHHWFR